jgi:hypothetical protein
VAGAPNVALRIGGCLDHAYFANFRTRRMAQLSGPAERVAAEEATFQAKLYDAVMAAVSAVVPAPAPAATAGPRGVANVKSITAEFFPSVPGGAGRHRGRHAARAVLVKRCPYGAYRSRPRIAAKDWLPAHPEANQVPAQGGSVAERVAAMAEWADHLVSTSNPVLYLWRHSSQMQPWPSGDDSPSPSPPSRKRRKTDTKPGSF